MIIEKALEVYDKLIDLKETQWKDELGSNASKMFKALDAAKIWHQKYYVFQEDLGEINKIFADLIPT